VSDETSPRRLLVSGRAVARYWGVHHALVAQAERAGLIQKHVITRETSSGEPPLEAAADIPAAGAAREVVEQGYDAARVLELGQRPFVDPDDLVAFDAESILLVQQTSIRRNGPGDVDWHWRAAYGWHVDMSLKDALDSARGWWAIEEGRRPGVQAIVSAVSSFVGTIALVDRGKPIEYHPDGRARFSVTQADDRTPLGRHLIRVFQGRRVPVRQGVSRLIPRVDGPLLG
jgi:hypothetical protein